LSDYFVHHLFRGSQEITGSFDGFQSQQSSLRVARCSNKHQVLFQEGIEVDLWAIDADLSLECRVYVAEVLNQS